MLRGGVRGMGGGKGRRGKRGTESVFAASLKSRFTPANRLLHPRVAPPKPVFARVRTGCPYSIRACSNRCTPLVFARALPGPGCLNCTDQEEQAAAGREGSMRGRESAAEEASPGGGRAISSCAAAPSPSISAPPSPAVQLRLILTPSPVPHSHARPVSAATRAAWPG